MKKKPTENTQPEELSITSKKGPRLGEADQPRDPSRRSFLGTVGGAAAVTMAAQVIALEETARAADLTTIPPGDLGGSPSACEFGPLTDSQRAQASQNERVNVATAEFNQPLVSHPCNGDDSLYKDKCGTYTKALPHDSVGRVSKSAYATLQNALSSGNPADFENITLGGTAKLTNPQSGLAFDLEGTDSHNLSAPPAPTIAGKQTAAEMVEIYWASLLRDIPFDQYPTNTTAQAAAAELTGLSAYTGPRDSTGNVTPSLLFKGGLGSTFAGETLGPYTSQFAIQPTFLGVQPIGQQWQVFSAGQDFLTSFSDWLNVQNGGSTGLTLQNDSTFRYARDGRDWASFTHVDLLYQAYLVAALVLSTIHAPLNPGNPYDNSKTQVGFGTLGGPDIVGTMAEVATRALKAVWFQKWYVHRRLRPEATGGIAQLFKTGQGSKVSCTLDSSLLNSNAIQQSFTKYGSYLLSQAFPEGCPTHPSYPTGHGTVGGACITVLKFFFDGSQFIRPLLTAIGRDVYVPSANGTALSVYTGSDSGSLTINGELAKVGHNVSFAHGIHAGIHYRSDTDQSLLLGEALALSALQDRASTYNEKFSVSLTKFDGTTATISN